MKLTPLQKLVIQIVTDKQGCKANELVTELAMATTEMVNLGAVNAAQKIMEEIDELVKKDKLVEIEYVLPNMGYRIKGIYLPAGTLICVKGDAEVREEL